jgi:hypothetical protein
MSATFADSSAPQACALDVKQDADCLPSPSFFLFSFFLLFFLKKSKCHFEGPRSQEGYVDMLGALCFHMPVAGTIEIISAGRHQAGEPKRNQDRSV